MAINLLTCLDFKAGLSSSAVRQTVFWPALSVVAKGLILLAELKSVCWLWRLINKIVAAAESVVQSSVVHRS
ncbi:hypothetical protein A9R01_06235 ['Osedax' symbiont bacterium Rs2_46_30_T18]|nr:hypothetical protein A9R01_06235 ['Osedax' symbiont bacterium Rs2_46_30_T18]